MTVTDTPHPHTPRPHAPRLMLDLAAVSTRYQAAPTAPADGSRADLVGCAADIPALVSEVDRLYRLLVDTRRRYADLAAAARATLAAAADGEPDPLAYLRDELTGPAPWPGASTGEGCR
jgi:hypothetical protein